MGTLNLNLSPILFAKAGDADFWRLFRNTTQRAPRLAAAKEPWAGSQDSGLRVEGLGHASAPLRLGR